MKRNEEWVEQAGGDVRKGVRFCLLTRYIRMIVIGSGREANSCLQPYDHYTKDFNIGIGTSYIKFSNRLFHFGQPKPQLG